MTKINDYAETIRRHNTTIRARSVQASREIVSIIEIGYVSEERRAENMVAEAIRLGYDEGILRAFNIVRAEIAFQPAQKELLEKIATLIQVECSQEF